MIDKSLVKKRYSNIKKSALKELKNGNEEKSLQYIKYAAEFMYENNIAFVDYKLEKLGNTVVNKIIGNPNVAIKNVILFYQYMPMDIRGLAYIYLNALTKSGREFVWVTYKSYKTEEQKRLMKMINQCDTAKVVILNDMEGSVKLVQEWEKILNAICPQKALLIPAPWDVECISSINQYHEIYKIFVNGTDHAFWYGASVFNLILEFRDWGWKVSKEYRNIDSNKLIKFPYYPCPTNEKFMGFPFEVDGDTKVICSGGSFYKVYGSPIFLETVKYILDKHPECIFLFMGNGDRQIIDDFIHKNSLQNKFFVTKERKDFDEVIKNSYLYLNTYPLIGALMTQYAVANGIIPVGLNDGLDSCNDVSALFLRNGITNAKDKDELWRELDRLIDDKSYYKMKTENLNGMLLNEEEFNTYLIKIIDGTFMGYGFNEVQVDINQLRKPYLERQVRSKALLKYYGKKLMIKYPCIRKLRKPKSR